MEIIVVVPNLCLYNQVLSYFCRYLLGIHLRLLCFVFKEETNI